MPQEDGSLNRKLDKVSYYFNLIKGWYNFLKIRTLNSFNEEQKRK